MMSFSTVLRRMHNSAVVWSWAVNGYKIASGLLLLPILLKVLSKQDLGMYYVFVSLAALVPIIDFGLSVAINRFVSYAMAGATELKPQGLVSTDQQGPPNYPLVWRLLYTTQRLYGLIALIALVLLGTAGTGIVSLRVQETSSPQLTWIAWGLTLASVAAEIYVLWWATFLNGMNQVLLSARIVVFAYFVKLVLACILLLCGAGLLAWPMAGLVSSFLMWQLARPSCLRRLEGSPPPGARSLALLRVLWPNSWRAGLQFLSAYLSTHANALICAKVFGLAASAQYGLSLQLVNAVYSMSIVWVTVKWPLVGQYRTREDYEGLRRLLAPRFRLEVLTFVILALAVFFLGPPLLRWHAADQEILPPMWFGFLLLNSFLELQFSFWGTLLSMENRIPSLWPTVATNVASLFLVLALLQWASLGIGTFVVGPLLMGCLFNYWYWAKTGASSLRTDWLRFTFSRA